jgi:5-methylcytosine-specific restriction endonuclease McrA
LNSEVEENVEAETIIVKTDYQNENGCNHKTKRTPDNRLKLKVMWRDGNVCRLCGIKLSVWEEGHFDHIVPWSKCGETILDNLQILCAKCNLVKGSLDLTKEAG